METRREAGPDAEHAHPGGGGFYDLVAIAASAGGLEPVSHILSCLPRDFSSAVVVVVHLAPHFKSKLSEILARRCPLMVKPAVDGEHILPGIVYVAPPDFHTTIARGGLVWLDPSEPVHFTRPSADRLFASAAAWYGSRAIAVILSGMGMDGSLGLSAIKQAGGVTIAQDQATSEFFGMPGAAIRSGHVDYILPLDLVAKAVNQLVKAGSYSV